MLAVFSSGSSQYHIRVEVDSEGVEWWHGTHVCEVLEMQNPTLVLQRHVDSDFRQQISWGDRGMPAWYVNEPGLYQLIFASKSAMAKAFQRWVFKELLPSIRKTGAYQAKPEDSDRFRTIGIKALIAMDEVVEALNRSIEDPVAVGHYSSAVKALNGVLDRTDRKSEPVLKTKGTVVSSRNIDRRTLIKNKIVAKTEAMGGSASIAVLYRNIYLLRNFAKSEDLSIAAATKALCQELQSENFGTVTKDSFVLKR